MIKHRRVEEGGAQSDPKEAEVRDRVSPPGEIVYEAIYREGEHELRRKNRELWWSGLAAGLSMGFSSLSEALLKSRLPDTTWTPAVAKFGYAIGFLIVILGRQQLFTKNTITVILPLLNHRDRTGVRQVARLWAVVLGANIVGALLFACLLAFTHTVGPEVHAALQELGRTELGGDGFVTSMFRSVVAGWLIALIIWLMPFAESGRFWVILALAYIVALGHFPHIVAGAVPTLYVVLTGHASVGQFLMGFLLPAFVGNAIGGVACVAAVAHAELAEESRGRGR